MNFNIGKIKKSNLCLGCGLCQSFTSDIKMIIDENGFIVPGKDSIITGKSGDNLNKICPGINIECVKPAETLFGNVEGVYEGWAKDPDIRFHSSSGGIITAVCCHLLESKKVDGIIQVRVSSEDFLHNVVTISRSKEDIINSASSRYAPVAMFGDIKRILEKESRFAFVGKPCDIMTISRLIEIQPEWKSKILFKISLVCAGIPSYKATESLIEKGKRGEKKNICSLKYRGDGWPGKFRVTYDDKSDYELDYNESWGKILGRNLNYRCKICPDGVGQYADIVVGDNWSSKDGYPDFTEQDGKCFILARTQIGKSILLESEQYNYITFHNLDIDNIKTIQQYQYHRLEYAAYRLIGAKLCLGSLIRINNLNFHPHTFKKGIRLTLGAIKRFIKR